jgi:hypothetical protein
MNPLGPVNLPQGFATDYDKRLSVMLYQYLRDVNQKLHLDRVDAPVSSVEFNQQQALQFCIENRTDDPASPATGQIWLRTDL